MTDAELIRDFKNGKNEALALLIEKYKTPLFSYILKLVKDENVASDLFQEIFIKFIKTVDHYREQEKFSHWIWTVAHHAVVDYIRTSRKEIVSIDETDKKRRPLVETIKSTESTPEQIIINAQEKKCIENAIKKLPMEQQEIIFMRHYSGLSFKEISKILKIPIGTCLARMSRAVSKLRNELKEKNFGNFC